MKYIRKFNEEVEISIEDWCRKLQLKNYIINNDGTVDVDNGVFIQGKRLDKIPIKFGVVTWHFQCFNNRLALLKGCPEKVGGNFNCGTNQLTTLEYLPLYIDGGFIDCYYNKLTSLDFVSNDFNGDLDCE